VGHQLVLFSGGADSTAILALAGKRARALHVVYNHPAWRAEAEAAEAVAKLLGAPLDKVSIELPTAGISGACPVCGASGSERCHDCSGYGAAHAERRSLDPALPGRNGVLIALGLAYGAAYGCSEVAIGATAADGYFADCGARYIRDLSDANEAIELPRVVAPLRHRTRPQIRTILQRFEIPPEILSSCYLGDNCGRCMSCRQDADQTADALEGRR
jgi:7-cyano-7-deazaguanine synthase in queuosine biosynthesis